MSEETTEKTTSYENINISKFIIKIDDIHSSS